MIVLKITNASEVMASKVGKFLESLTPDGFDQTTVEDIVLRKLAENLAAEGIRGEVLAVQGLEIESEGTGLVLRERVRVRQHARF
jgi:hypothetical protein